MLKISAFCFEHFEKVTKDGVKRRNIVAQSQILHCKLIVVLVLRRQRLPKPYSFENTPFDHAIHMVGICERCEEKGTHDIDLVAVFGRE